MHDPAPAKPQERPMQNERERLIEQYAREIYEAHGYAYDGKTINGQGEPYGEWATAIIAARRVAALSRQETEPVERCTTCGFVVDTRYAADLDWLVARIRAELAAAQVDLDPDITAALSENRSDLYGNIALASPPAHAGAVMEAVREALIYYANHGAGCRLIHSGGDASRNALAKDGGKRAENALTALTAALGAQTPPEGAVTEAQGWRLVPIIPTNEMLAACRAVDLPSPDIYGDFSDDRKERAGDDLYRAMLAAAPTPPVNQSEGADRG